MLYSRRCEVPALALPLPEMASRWRRRRIYCTPVHCTFSTIFSSFLRRLPLSRQRLCRPALGVLGSLALLGCWTDAPSSQLDQSVQGLYDGDISTDGRYSLVASIHHGASLWRLRDGERLYNWNHSPKEYSQIDYVALSGNGAIGATAYQRQLVAWSSKNGKPIEFWEMPGEISCLQLNGSGSHALLGMKTGQALIIDIKNNGFVWKATLPHPISACSLSKKNALVALGTTGGDVTLFSFKAQSTKEVRTWTGQEQLNLTHPYAISHVNTLPSKFLVSASQHHELWFTDIQSGETVHTLPLKSTSVTATLEAKEGIILANTHRQVQLLDTTNWTLLDTVHIPKRNQWKPSGAYLSSIVYVKNSLFATGSDGVTHIYDNPFSK